MDWQLLALSCLIFINEKGQTEGIFSLETDYEYMENKSKFFSSLST